MNLMDLIFRLDQMQQGSLMEILLTVFTVIALYQGIFITLRIWAKKTSHTFPFLLNKHLYYPGLMLFIEGSLLLIFPIIRSYLSSPLSDIFRHVLYLLLTGTFAFLAIRILYLFYDMLKHRLDISRSDNLRERKILTRTHLIVRVLTFFIILLAFAVGILSFEKIRAIGTAILASAGILSLIVGFAAQKSLSTFIAGIQIAFTQPIRHDDVVIVEGEWGRIEEITLTYVVVKIWDERRLVLPINYFLEKPFQNWTRTKSDLLGSVFLYVDYSFPVEILRKEFENYIESRPLWDGRVKVLQVTNITEKAMEIRVLVSARSSSDAFDLRCEIREHLLAFIQKNFPQYFPFSRVDKGSGKELLS